jgi:hypothetical protein
VPKGAKTAYAAADYWKEFKEIVEISPNMGDANGDGVVNVADVVEAVNAMNDKTSTKFKFSYADLNQKGKIDQTDIDIIVNLIYSNIPKLYIPEPVPVPTQGDRNAVGSGGGFL